MHYCNASIVHTLLPSQKTFYAFYDILDTTENLLSFGAATPWVGSVFANVKIVAGAALIGIGCSMLTTAALYDLHPLSRKHSDTRHRLISNGNHFIIQGLGNILAGSFERHLLLGTALWVARVGLRFVKGDSEQMTGWDLVLQKHLFKIIRAPVPPDIKFTIAEIEAQRRSYESFSKSSCVSDETYETFRYR